MNPNPIAHPSIPAAATGEVRATFRTRPEFGSGVAGQFERHLSSSLRNSGNDDAAPSKKPALRARSHEREDTRSNCVDDTLNLVASSNAVAAHVVPAGRPDSANGDEASAPAPSAVAAVGSTSVAASAAGGARVLTADRFADAGRGAAASSAATADSASESQGGTPSANADGTAAGSAPTGGTTSASGSKGSGSTGSAVAGPDGSQVNPSDAKTTALNNAISKMSAQNGSTSNDTVPGGSDRLDSTAAGSTTNNNASGPTADAASADDPAAASASALPLSVTAGTFAPGAGRHRIVGDVRWVPLPDGPVASSADAATTPGTHDPAGIVAARDATTASTPGFGLALDDGAAASIQQIVATAVSAPTSGTTAPPMPTITNNAGDAAPTAGATTLPAPQMQPALAATDIAASTSIAAAVPAFLAGAIASTASSRLSDAEPKGDRDGNAIDAALGISAAAPLSTGDVATTDGKTAAPPVHDAQFADVLGARLAWLAERHIGSAQITVSPRSMGSIDVRLTLDGERVRAAFASQNAEVRTAIEAHMPRLRELLAASGFTLTDAQVGGGNQHAPAPVVRDDADLEPVQSVSEAVAPAHRSPATGSGLVDEFA